MKRALTSEQEKARDERRARMQKIAADIRALSDEQRAELASNMMCATIEGHGLSIHNTCMLAMQNPTATIVGGFNQWKSNGRIVRKGERALTIWAPRSPSKAETEQAEAGEESADRPNFIMVSVFDVSQTETIQ